MTPVQGNAVRVVVQEEGPGGTIGRDRRLEVVRALLDRGHPVSYVRSHPSEGLDGTTVVVARFGGRRAGLKPRPTDETRSEVRCLDLDGADAAGCLPALDAMKDQEGMARAGAWKPWFPVIDYQRCTNCMQCLSFCLFDVYGVSGDGKIQVRNQTNCKTDCPACSRVCPEVAIMFPKYRHGPINGDEVQADDVRREAMKVDISSLLGGDVYAALRDRSAKAKSRFSKERDDQRALKERQKCLVQLGQTLDVPPEVMAALPSLEEIRAKADAALERARQATGTPEGS